ncbi:TonB-dependent siderophore receptor [Trinickia violacea]|uniref:TonB-dependent siderophore receptor n=1 Tax=Trinickia violacea TaxID=2571746 RepID=UPI0020C7B2FE|nr:TonB-dependent siderophore receptor [Trinickia violacea]
MKGWQRRGRRRRVACLGSLIVSQGLLLSAARHALAQETATGAAAGAGQATAAVEAAHTLTEVTVQGARAVDEVGYQPRRASVATRTDTPLVDVPQAVNVVTQQSIEDRAPASLADALDAVPGVRMGNTLGGTLDAIVKRGFGDNRDNSILRDGMQSVQPRNFTPTTERIEVLKGPASMLYGIQDPGGIINVVTKKPQLDFAGSVSGFGSNYGGGGAQVDLTGPIGTSGLAYRFIADHQRVDYWRNFGQTRQDVIAPSLAWYGRDTTVLVAYEHMSYSVPLDRGTIIDPRTGNPAAIPATERLDEPYNVSTGRSDAVNLRIDHKLANDWTLHFGYGFNRTYYNDWQARVLSANFNTGYLTRRVDSTQNATQTVHNVTLNVEGKLRIAGFDNDLLAGVDYMHNYRLLGELYRGKNNSTFNLYAPVYGLLPQTSTLSNADSDQTDKLISRGAFIQDSLHLSDRWIVLGGLRYESFDELTGKGRPFVVGSHVDAGKVVPRAGVVYKIDPNWSLYASYSESFRPNTSIAQPIGDLPPEEAKAYEVGSKYVSRNLTASVALFDIHKKNIQTTETIGGINYTRNAGRAYSRGVELEMNGKLTDKWSVIGSYAYTEARYQDDPKIAGNPLPNAPKHEAALYLTRDFGVIGSGPVSGRLRAGAGGRVFSSLAVGDGTGKVYRLPWGHVADAFVAWDSRIFGRTIDWQFNVNNVFNSTYYTSSCCTGLPFVTIGAAREFRFSGRLEF